MNFIFNGAFNPQGDVQLNSSNIDDFYDFSLILKTDQHNSYTIHSSVEYVNQQDLSIFQSGLNNHNDCSLSFLNEVLFIVKFEGNKTLLTIKNNMRFFMASELQIDIDDNEFERMKIAFQEIKDYIDMIYEQNFNE